MIHRIKGCVVVLSEDTRADDFEFILNAIRMIKGVSAVEPIEADPQADFIVRHRTVQKVREKIYGLLEDLNRID